MFFFFSSRRRHTRLTCDWSSDVCSSDLKIDEMVDSAEKLPLLDEKRLQLYRQMEDIVINQDVAFVGMYQSLAISLSQPYVRSEERRVGKECRSGWSS